MIGLSRFRALRTCLGRRAAAYSTDTGSSDHIGNLLRQKKIVVFIKGTPEAPRCGFTNLVLQILRVHGVHDYGAHDVLADERLRQGIKEYSSWPTIPQVFIDSEFVGGSDIMLEKHKSGEFIEDLRKIGIRSLLLDKPPE